MSETGISASGAANKWLPSEVILLLFSYFICKNGHMPTRTGMRPLMCFAEQQLTIMCVLVCWCSLRIYSLWRPMTYIFCHSQFTHPYSISLGDMNTGNANWRVNQMPIHNVNHFVLCCWSSCCQINPELWEGYKIVEGCSSSSLSGNTEQDLCGELAGGTWLKLATPDLYKFSRFLIAACQEGVQLLQHCDGWNSTSWAGSC